MLFSLNKIAKKYPFIFEKQEMRNKTNRNGI